jgi:hypothetical protein
MRRSGWSPSIVPNDRESNVLGDARDTADADRDRFKDLIPAAHFQTLDRRLEEDASVIQRRSDVAVSVGVAFALALPALVGLAIATLVLQQARRGL